MNGKLLLADLSEGAFADVTIPQNIADRYLGGRGLCAFYLYTYLTDDPLIFFCGALESSGYPMTGLCSVAHVSPRTGGLFRSSFGGRFSAALNSLGYDGLIIKGRSEKPVCLNLDNLLSFSSQPLKNSCTLEPQPAALKGIKHAGIVCDGFFSPHRGSTGYKMTSMNLKSISIKLPDSETDKPVNKESEDIDRLINAAPALTGRLGISRFGTAAFYDIALSRHLLPHNFFGTQPDDECNSFGLIRRGSYEKLSCGLCPVACKKINFPEYDELAMLAACGVVLADIPAVYGHCREQGYDIITVCHQIALYRKEIKDLSAAELIMGYDSVSELINLKSPLSVKGLEIPAFDPRGAVGTALGYVTSSIGADWQTAMAITHELLRKPVPTDRLSCEGKAYMNIATENAVAAYQSLSVCPLALISVSSEEYAAALSRFTGRSYTSADLDRTGAETVSLERKLAGSLGFGHETDVLPDIFFKESCEALKPIDKTSFDNELTKYYRLRGEI